tara:strand:- start:6 stop:677 length:672 start_codon:yes stop_codon:yes gene_type:complete
MAKPYFRYVPDFDYVSRLTDAKSISDYVRTKNLFKRAKLRPDIFENLNHFTKYKIIGDDRPDNVAYEVYGDQNLDWLIMLSNNIINLENEWPMEQTAFHNYLLKKYRTNAKIYSVRHYETAELKDSTGKIVVPKGLEVPSDFSITYYDSGRGVEDEVVNSAVAVTNYTYEDRIQENKRNIFLLKDRYVGLVVEDLKEIMPYKKGSTQFVSKTLARGENIRLYN